MVMVIRGMGISRKLYKAATPVPMYREILLLPDPRKNTGSATENLGGEPVADPEAGSPTFVGDNSLAYSVDKTALEGSVSHFPL
jgi:hypothetical protein